MSEDERQRALELAYRQLGRRERSTAELRAYLVRRELDPEAVEATLGVLVEQGYLDDARFAEHYAADRRALDGWGRERIARGLRAAGVDAELAATALEGQDPEEELQAAVELLRRRHPDAPRDPAGRRRALGLLVRRGYAVELAHAALRRHEREAAEAA